ncbi:MAG: methylmalonyl Co-A mutase-associated GTPase MeaB [bacterium]
MTVSVEKILAGDIRAVARLIRMIDDENPQARAILKQLFPHTGRAVVIGLTGPPGVGKSTLSDRLISTMRKKGQTVGVLAVDPTSPFSGGAILGDRIRMREHTLDQGVFIRSIATRGEFGGITTSTRGAVTVLDAMGKDVILVETVGVGQDEIDIARVADTTVIVLAPGLGDGIQTIKAGILEVGDIFVVNKADRAGADAAVHELEAMLKQRSPTAHDAESWQPPVIETVATENRGIENLWSAITAHGRYLSRAPTPEQIQRRFLYHKLELIELVKKQFMDRILKELDGQGDLDRYVEAIIEGRTDPYTVSEEILIALDRKRAPDDT